MKDENIIKPERSDILQTLFSIMKDKIEHTNSKLDDFEKDLHIISEAASNL